MDLGVIIAIIGGSIAIVATTISMFFWVRSEANADRRHFQEITREDRKDILNLIRSIELEMKDFHYQLVNLKEK